VNLEVLTMVLLKFKVFWDIAPCRLVTSYWHFERDNTVPTSSGWTILLGLVGIYLPVDRAYLQKNILFDDAFVC
jgi:hypothetical protein